MKKPIIGINCEWRAREEYSPQLYLNYNYLEAIRHAAGIPLILPLAEDKELQHSLLQQIHGLILVGGEDLNPESYRQQSIPLTRLMDKRRQDFDFWLVERAVSLRLPTLGICGGHQEINVALGGDLYQDITADFPDTQIAHRRLAGRRITRHPVKILPDSLLFRIVGKEEISTNSSHHQSVKTVGNGLRAAAFAPDGVIEAIESENPGHFMLGVQWHPEYLTDEPEHLQLFQALVEAAEQYREHKSSPQATS